MALVSLREVCLGFGGPRVLEFVNLQIERGERIGLLGRNGSGKSSLLKLIYGDHSPIEGEIAFQQNTRLAYLPQEVPDGLTGTVAEIVAAGQEPLIGGAGDPDQAWQQQLQVDQIITRMQLDPRAEFATLSAGLKRRVLLARGLARSPDLLLLDEPTNHLDIDAIAWLEDFLLRWGGTLLFVTHDRSFLQRVSTRIVELDSGRLLDWRSDYTTFLRRREAILKGEEGQAASFDKKLAQEEAWIRRGVEARRTRNEGRVRALLRLREERAARRERGGKVRMRLHEGQRSGRLVAEVEGVRYGYGALPAETDPENGLVIRDFSTTVLRGDKVGIIGPNGSGKTTLLRLLLGELQPQAGKIRLGTHLSVAYFDQLRAQLDEEKSAYENVGQNHDHVTINGKTRTLVSYMEDFLFSYDRGKVPVRVLSGGERNRLLLARLFSRPANLLVLDEPTNDLDLETLELLEDLLLEFPGTLLLVSHDRTLLNNVVTSTLVLEGSGRVGEYVGGYDDWLRQRPDQAEDPARPAEAKPAQPASLAADRPRRLTYKEQLAQQARAQELADLPGQIETLETEQADLVAEIANPSAAPGGVARAAARLQVIEEELARAYARWAELEDLAG
jgi:ATP-binding cassette subfamily F protein uup